MAEAMAIAHRGSQPDHHHSAGQCELQGSHLAGLQLMREGGAHPVLPDFISASPQRLQGALAMQLHRDSHVYVVTRETPCFFASRSVRAGDCIRPLHCSPLSRLSRNLQLPCNTYPGSKGSLPPTRTTSMPPVMEYTSTSPTPPGVASTFFTTASSESTTMIAGRSLRP